jgi:hypothetical protein
MGIGAGYGGADETIAGKIDANYHDSLQPALQTLLRKRAANHAVQGHDGGIYV